MNKFAIALLLGTVFAVGCGDKTDAAGSGSAKASGAPSGSAKATASGAATTTAAAAGGSKTCDDYWAKLKSCNEKMVAALPEAGREAQKKSNEEMETKMKESWKAFDAAMLETTCKTSLETLEKTCPK